MLPENTQPLGSAILTIAFKLHQRVLDLWVNTRAHKRIQGPTVLHALLYVRPQAVLRMRPIAGVRVLLILHHQSWWAELRQQAVSG